MDIIWFLFIGLIAGWIAAHIMKGRGFGLFGDIIVGIIGAVIGLAVVIGGRLIAELVITYLGQTVVC